jgi:hypothetical protein
MAREVVTAAKASLDVSDRSIIASKDEGAVDEALQHERNAAAIQQLGETQNRLDDIFSSQFGLTMGEMEKIRREGFEGNEDLLTKQARRMAGQPSEKPRFRTAAEREEDELS